MQHSFDIDIAKEYGILEAILLNNLWFWIEKNRANNTNYYDGYYWTYNSTRAFNELFPYVSQRQIQCALKRLIEEEILQTGNYNKVAYDRTLWYAFTEKGKCIMQKCKMEDAKMLNGLGKNDEPIPDINTNNKITDINTDIYSPAKAEQCTIPYKEIIDYLNERTGSNYKHTTKKTKDLIKARFNEGFNLDDFKIVIDKKTMEWINDKEMNKYLRPETLFGTKFESYLNQSVQQKQQTYNNPFMEALKGMSENE